MDTLIGCVYKDCGWPATVFVRAPEISGEEIPLCDGCIADWMALTLLTDVSHLSY